MKKLIILALTAYLTFQTASAWIIVSQEPSNWYNLVIGINQYNDEKINLQGSENNVDLLTDSLLNLLGNVNGIYDQAFEHPLAARAITLINNNAQSYMINGWWDQTLNNIKSGDTIFFSFSGIGIPDNGLLINDDLTIKDTKILEWLLKAVDKGAKVILALDTCSNLDEILSGLKKPFKNKVVLIKPKSSDDTVNITVDGKQYGITSYLLSQIFLGKVLNKAGEPIHRAGEIKSYLVEEAKKYNREISIYGINESNEDWIFLPTKFRGPSSNVIVEDIVVGDSKKSDIK